MTSVKRRDFFKIAGASVAVLAGGKLAFGEGVSVAEQSQILKNISGNPSLPSFDGTFVYDTNVCRAMATDFGHYVHNMPIGVLFPKSCKDVQKAVCFANSQNLKIAMRGTGGAAYGQSQVAQGIVIDSSSLNSIKWVASDMIDAGPGALWKEITDFTMARQMAPPVLPDTLYISVGGTLNAGGIGETSYRLGAQVDHVEELEVITGAGDRVTCSATSNCELFQMILAGMGQCGIIVRARLRLLPAPNQVTTRHITYTDRAAFLGDLAMVAQSEMSGAIAGDLNLNSDKVSWSYVMSVTSVGTAEPSWLAAMKGVYDQKPATMSYSDYLNRSTQGYLAAVASGALFTPHVYMAFFLPAEQSLSMVNYLMDTPGVTAGAAQIAIFPMINANFGQPLQRMPAAPLSYHMRIYRKTPQEGSADHLQMLSLNQNDFLPRVLSLGGTVYLPFSPLLTPAQKVQHFGRATFDRFVGAKSKFDPQGVLTPGLG